MFFAEIVNILWLLPVSAEKPHPILDVQQESQYDSAQVFIYLFT